MNRFPSREQVERLRQQYPEGTKICCDYMQDDPRPIQPGTMGRVLFVDDVGTVHCAFDNGRQLGLVSGVDSFHIVTLIDEMRTMGQDELCEYGIIKFDSFEELFDYIYDENTDKEDIINDMSDKMKKELINNNYSDRIMSDGKAFYYNSDDFSELQIQRHDEIDSDAESFQTENDKEYVVSGKLVDREKCRYGDVYVTTCYDSGIERWDNDSLILRRCTRGSRSHRADTHLSFVWQMYQCSLLSPIQNQLNLQSDQLFQSASTVSFQFLFKPFCVFIQQEVFLIAIDIRFKPKRPCVFVLAALEIVFRVIIQTPRLW